MPAGTAKGPYVPDFAVSINGSPLPVEAEPSVTGVTVEESVELPSMFTLEMSGSEQGREDALWVDDAGLFAVGNVVEVKLGYLDDVRSLLVGEITALEPEFFFDRAPLLRVRGFDRRHRLQRGRRTRTFLQQKDSEIAAQVAGEAGLTAKAEDSAIVHDYVLQANQTDLDFLHERARRINYEVVVEDKTLLFRPVRNDGGEVLTLTLEDDLLEFRPRLTSSRQVSEVTVRGWSPKEKKEIVGKAKSGDESSAMGGESSGAALAEGAFGAAPGTVTDLPVMTQGEADQLAKARFNHLSLELIGGEGVCLGRADLRSGQVIKIDGVGARFSGQYYVSSALHHYAAGRGYRTRFTVRRNAS